MWISMWRKNAQGSHLLLPSVCGLQMDDDGKAKTFHRWARYLHRTGSIKDPVTNDTAALSRASRTACIKKTRDISERLVVWVQIQGV